MSMDQLPSFKAPHKGGLTVMKKKKDEDDEVDVSTLPGSDRTLKGGLTIMKKLAESNTFKVIITNITKYNNVE